MCLTYNINSLAALKIQDSLGEDVIIIYKSNGNDMCIRVSINLYDKYKSQPWAPILILLLKINSEKQAVRRS